MATGPKIVHKQFNSPIGLYSQQNIQETLNKHLQNLDNGTVGIDFNNPGANKPANLANSAVLRMLEEEERNRKGLPKLDPTQIQAIMDNLVLARRRFDSSWPPRKEDSVRRGWHLLDTTGHIYSDFLKATKGTGLDTSRRSLPLCNEVDSQSQFQQLVYSKNVTN
ncbi:hypothetical protein RR48_14494 [Papilio machaon]|uniref:Zasp-like motif domain-containing protein n=1 Tax=Papilio machaon TaxID=76193 RepID=A0A194QKK1_PAPMA|nr:hypothetical protein RR48_14494 [Papilio machaon]